MRIMLFVIMLFSLAVVMFCDFDNSKKEVVVYSKYTDCYINGYYDGRKAIYGALKQENLTYSYLDSTFSADSLRFINNLK